LQLRSQSTYPNGHAEGSLPKSYRNPSGYLGYAHSPDLAVGSASWIRPQQGHPYQVRRNPKGGHRLALSRPAPPGAQRMDCCRMEKIRRRPSLADLSTHQIGEETTVGGTLPLGNPHGGDCGG